MGERRSLGRLAREPLYNTRAVVQLTGVPADTFRAWERRYGVPRPFRTASKQRLYSEQDTGVISWLRDRTGEGMTISQAIQRLKLEVPDVLVTEQTTEAPIPDFPVAPQIDGLQQRFVDAVIGFDTEGAESVVDEALARFSVEAFGTWLVEPLLQEIKHRRELRQISVAVEHFAIRLIERRLSAILTLAGPGSGHRTSIVGCPAGEPNEVALLLLAIVLSRRGWRVIYLGSRMTTDALVEAARAIRPDMVCLCVSTADGASNASIATRALRSTNERWLPVVVVRSVAEAVDQIAGLGDLEWVG